MSDPIPGQAPESKDEFKAPETGSDKPKANPINRNVMNDIRNKVLRNSEARHSLYETIDSLDRETLLSWIDQLNDTISSEKQANSFNIDKNGMCIDRHAGIHEFELNLEMIRNRALIRLKELDKSISE